MLHRPNRSFPIIVLIVAAIITAMIGFWPEIPRQQRYLRGLGTIFIAGLLVLGWIFFFSRISIRSRLYLFAGIVVAILSLAGMFRIRGVSGDLVPILEPRWRAEQSWAPSQPSPASTPKRAWVSGEFLQFYGPNRDARLASPELETNWTAHPPEILWKQPMGRAWSGFAVKDGLAITLEQRAEQESVTCYDMLMGRSIWVHADQARFMNTIAGEGPRTTPTIVGNRVFTFGSTGLLNCFDLETGRRIWSRDIVRDLQAEIPEWGFASSPLVTDEKVIINAGGSASRSLAAYSALNGELAWATGSGGVDYSSPIEAEFYGIRQVLIFDSAGVSAHALDGKALWRYPWPGKHPHVSVPVVTGTNTLLISSGYGTGIEHVQIDLTPQGTWETSRLWKSIALKSKFGPILVKDDYIYGLDDGILACADLKTGQRQWKDGRYGHGQALLVSGIILLTSEKGEVILIEPNPQKLSEIARIPVLSGKSWNPPALAGTYLFVRNDQEAACLKLPVRHRFSKNAPVLFAKPVQFR